MKHNKTLFKSVQCAEVWTYINVFFSASRPEEIIHRMHGLFTIVSDVHLIVSMLQYKGNIHWDTVLRHTKILMEMKFEIQTSVGGS